MRSGRNLRATLLFLPVVAAVLFFLLPLIGLLVRAPWSEFVPNLVSAPVVDALRLSLICSLSAAACSFVLGLPVAVWLANGSSWERSAVRVLVTLPMVLPPIVGGVALFLAYGRSGITGLSLPFTTTAVVVAETYVAMPFFVLTAEAGLRSFDQSYARAAATLGAGPWRTFWTVTVPMIAPSVRAGLVVAWARALGEFGATITFAGNLQGTTRTMPLAIYKAFEKHPDSAIVLSIVLVVIAAGLLFVLRDRWLPR